MGFRRVLGQEQAARAFQGILTKGRLAHAYLFLGPPGVGKAMFAREVAKAVLCRDPQPDACDACESCRRFDAGRHADFHLTEPAEGKRSISVDDIRSLQASIAIKAIERGHKVFVVDDAHRMTPEAANAFLKTLEEPPPKSLLVLVAPTLEGMLDTIVSRCQRVRFRSIAPDVIVHVLASEHGVPPDRAAALANFAGGSIGRAVTLVGEDSDELRDWVFALPGQLTPLAALGLAEQVLGRTRQSGAPLEQTRERLREVFLLLLLYYRDLLMLHTDAPGAKVLNTDRLAALHEHAGRWSARGLEAAADRVLDAMSQLDMNVNVTLLVEGLLTDLARGPATSSLPSRSR